MKKKILFPLLLLSLYASAQKLPVKRGDTTVLVMDAYIMGYRSLGMPVSADTTLQGGNDSLGMLRYRKIDSSVYVRSLNPSGGHYWQKFLSGTSTSVTSFNGRIGAVLPLTGDYDATMVTNAVNYLGGYFNPPFLTGVNWSIINNTPTTVAGYGITDAVTLTGTQTLTNKTLTSPVINVGGDATGDIYYRSSLMSFARLGIGSTGQVLTTVSGLPAWATPATIDSSVFATRRWTDSLFGTISLSLNNGSATTWNAGTNAVDLGGSATGSVIINMGGTGRLFEVTNAQSVEIGSRESGSGSDNAFISLSDTSLQMEVINPASSKLTVIHQYADSITFYNNHGNYTIFNIHTGTAAYAIGVDANNHMVQAAIGTGSVTSVATGIGLTGGTITTSGTLKADTNYLVRWNDTTGTGANTLVTLNYFNTHASASINSRTNGTFSSNTSLVIPSGYQVLSIIIIPTSTLTSFQAGTTSSGSDIIGNQAIGTSGMTFQINGYYPTGVTIYFQGITSSTQIITTQANLN